MLKFAVKRKPVELFHEAVHKKDLLRATFLLEQNESQFHIDDIDEDGITALQRTCFTGTLGLVQLLVTNGAEINIQDNEGWSVLHAATVARNHSIMRYLIAAGAPLGLQNDQGELAIDLARDLQSIVILVDGMRRAGLTKEVEDYLRDRPEVRGILEEKLRQSDMVTQEQGRQRAASEILPPNMSTKYAGRQQRRSFFADNPQPVTTAVKSKDNDLKGLTDPRPTDVVLLNRHLIESPINSSSLNFGAREPCALCSKCGKRRQQIVKRRSTISLCSESSDSSSSSDSAYSSGSTNSAGNVYALEQNDGTMNTAKENNHMGAENHRVYARVHTTTIPPETVKYTNNYDRQNVQGESVSRQKRISSSAKQTSSFQYQGRSYSPAKNRSDTGNANFLHQDHIIQSQEYQFSPRLHSPMINSKGDRSCVYGSPPILNATENVINVNELNGRGVSLLHEAAAKGDAEEVKLLLLRGAEVNRQSLNGSSPLHEAVRAGKTMTAYVLIEHGADLFSETDNGLLPEDLAPNVHMKRLLHKAMALK